MLKNVVSKLFILTVAATLVSCSKSSTTSGPVGALMATYTALQNQDSIGFIQSLTLERQNEYAMYPERITKLLQDWKGDSAHVQVLSIKQNDTFATVLYNLKVTGKTPRSRDSITADLYNRYGSWKHGF